MNLKLSSMILKLVQRISYYYYYYYYYCRPSASKGPQGWPQGSNKKNLKSSKNIENFGTDLGLFGADLGTVWGHFRDDFGPTLKTRKIESSELKNNLKMTSNRPLGPGVGSIQDPQPKTPK